ncbi:hypothetical protein SUGI_0575220 [Cryptomeria japonica]|uniref:uncharacterized protein LOC131044750 n=1 Tax=Cryptomeria japonica TaxID=3369 RepID=UPI002408DA79|nr:uncharacterized protein LOC131044750 [Cryptomeria japonica]GLJ29174.1 hypothetical protein SUGI_0575220 [Cryptomeria japonica]
MGKKPCFNPYSTVGLDKFDSLNAELSAKREFVARKTGIPEAMVRFAHTSKGWVPVVLKNGHGGNDGGHSSLVSIGTEQDTVNREKYEGEPNEEYGNDDVEGDEGHENGVNGSSSRKESVSVTVSMQGLPWWSGYLKPTAFGVVTVSAILVSNLVVPATAMVVVMMALAGSLQRLWLCGVMCMKSFINKGISYFSEILKTKEVKQPVCCDQSEPHEASPEQGGPLLYNTLAQATVFSAPNNSSSSQDLNTQQREMKNNNKTQKTQGTESREGQPRKPIRLEQSGNFSRRAESGESDVAVGATLMIILLFFLVVYGRICAICLTSALLYVVPKLRTNGSNDTYSNNYDHMVLQSKEYRKKVIMDGLLARNHGKL